MEKQIEKVDILEIHQIIAEILEVEVAEVEQCEDLVEDLDADSIAILELLVALEKRFKIKIPEEKLLDFNEVSNIVMAVEDAL